MAVDSNERHQGAVIPSSHHSDAVRVLLWCGVLSSLVYVATDWLAAMRWDGYVLVDRAVSELLAVGAPTRSFVVPPMTLYNVLVMAFGIGVWFAARGKRSLRTAGVLLAVYGVVSQLGLTAFPLRPDSGLSATGQMPLSGVLHSGATFALVALMFAFIGFGAAGLGKGFRWYSVVTVLVVLGGGVWAGSMIERIAAGEIIAWFGVLERSNIYGALLWVAVFAVTLIRTAPVPSRSGAVSAESTKKVLVLNGSPHKGGATYNASRMFLDRLESYGDVEGEIVTLSDYRLGVCRGCKVCFDYGEERCPLKDDRDVLIGKMAAADAVVFASPNYSWDVPGAMKVFLDRLGFAFHRPRFHGKLASSIVVQGMFRGGKIRDYLEFVAGGLGFRVVKGSVMRTLEPMSEAALLKMDKALTDQSKRFHEGLLKPAFPAPSLLQLVMFRASRTGVRNSAPKDKRDYAYFGEQGWFESAFYYPVHLGAFKRAVGRFADWFTMRARLFDVAED